MWDSLESHQRVTTPEPTVKNKNPSESVKQEFALNVERVFETSQLNENQGFRVVLNIWNDQVSPAHGTSPSVRTSNIKKKKKRMNE